MIIFKVLSNLYTNKDSQWILDVDEAFIKPYVIQRWLCMDDNIRQYTRWLDKYAIRLPPKMYLSLAWSVIPKVPKAPYIKYLKKEEPIEEFKELLAKIQSRYKMSDTDFQVVKPFILEDINKIPVGDFTEDQMLKIKGQLDSRR
jgi:hypothetical protein